MHNKINLWDWVSYSPEFISTLNDPEELEGRIGQVMRVHQFGETEVATVQWDDDDNLGVISACYLVVLNKEATKYQPKIVLDAITNALGREGK